MSSLADRVLQETREGRALAAEYTLTVPRPVFDALNVDRLRNSLRRLGVSVAFRHRTSNTDRQRIEFTCRGGQVSAIAGELQLVAMDAMARQQPVLAADCIHAADTLLRLRAETR